MAICIFFMYTKMVTERNPQKFVNQTDTDFKSEESQKFDSTSN